MSACRIPLVPSQIELISSRDELNYQEVLDDFVNAEYIFVTTFNISEKRDELLESLRTAAEYAEVRIVTNIPTRYDTYYGQNPRNKAKKSIDNYTKRLMPGELESFSTFFHFNNHTKVVLTNNIAYVGSANFSDESERSRETGILIKDPSMVQLIIDNLVPLIEGEGIQYFGDLANKKQLAFSMYLSRIRTAIDEIQHGLYFYPDHPAPAELYYKWFDPYLANQVVSDMFDVLVEIQGEIDETVEGSELGAVCNMIDLDVVEQAKYLCDLGTPIWNLASFDEEDYAFEIIAEDTRMPEQLDEIVQQASEQASQRYKELAEEAEEDVEQLLVLLDVVINQLSKTIADLSILVSRQQSIDNT